MPPEAGAPGEGARLVGRSSTGERGVVGRRGRVVVERGVGDVEGEAPRSPLGEGVGTGSVVLVGRRAVGGPGQTLRRRVGGTTEVVGG